MHETPLDKVLAVIQHPYSFCLFLKGYEAEASRLVCIAVPHNTALHDGTVLGKVLK